MSNKENVMDVDKPEEDEMEESRDKFDEDDDEDKIESDEEEGDSSDDEGEDAEDQVYVPGDQLDPGQGLEVDERAYVVYNQCSLGPPCLSFDIIPDLAKEDFPVSLTCVAGTQAGKVTANNVVVFRMSNLHCVRPLDEDEDSDQDEPDEEKPVLRMAGIKHNGCINRVKYARIGPTPVCAAWGETGTVSVWNLNNVLQRLDIPSKEVYREETAPLQAFSGHKSEGFALDWNSKEPGVLASGDCNKNIYVWKPGDGGSWNISDKPYASHTRSVEDIRWSPFEANVMASCSCDRTIKIWDIRADPAAACMLTQGNVHNLSDVNVIDWNPTGDPFLLSGGDDGVIKVWDLRNFGGTSDPVAVFKHHTKAVTSLEWHREDSTVFASSGEDDQVALWDLALEKDTECADETDNKLKDLPPQLLFIHQGLKEIKEIHWHPKIAGLMVATSHTGFDVFKTISV